MAEREFEKLSELIPYDHFRTVESFEMAKAPSESRVTLGLKKEFMSRLDFILPWDGALDAYLRRCEAFEKLCESKGLDPKKTEIYMNDWGDRFLVTLDDEQSRKNFSFYVTSDEVKTLLEECCRIPAHRVAAAECLRSQSQGSLTEMG